MTEAEIIEIFKENKNQELIDKIIDNIEDIVVYINSYDVPKEIKQKIIQKKITKENVLKILKYSYLSNRIEIIKEKELNEAVDSLDQKQIKMELKSYLNPEIVIKKIYERRKNSVETILDKMHSEVEVIYCITKEPKIAKYIYENKQKQLQKQIKKIRKDNIFLWLTSKNVPTKVKEEIIENKKEVFKSALEEKNIIVIIYDYLNNISYIPAKIKEEIIKLKKEEIIKELQTQNITDELNYGSGAPQLKDLMIQTFINEKNIFDVLNSLEKNELLLDRIILLKKDIIAFKLNSLTSEEILTLEKYNLLDKIKTKVIINFKDIIENKLQSVEKENKIKILGRPDINDEIKKIILTELGINENLDYVIILLNKYENQNVIDYYKEVKERIIKNDINYDIFMQYGSNSQKYPNWFNDILEIKDIDEFVRIKKYVFETIYPKETKIYEISHFLELLNSYKKIYPLLKQLKNEKVVLNEDEIITLKLILKNQTSEVPKNYEELKQLRYKEYQKIKNKISFSLEQEILSTIALEDNIVDVEILKKLRQDNKNANNLLNKIDELITITKLYELIYSTQNQKQVIEYIFDSYEKVKLLQNIFSDYEEKIRKLYELEINTNLTRIEQMEEYVDEKLQEKYGGKVINVSDKNYILCAHIKGENETMDDLIQGKSTGEDNFISMSPISYKGQKFYYDFKYSNVALAYDRINEGSFICSALQNMGTNTHITNNNLEVEKINRNQRGILETSAVEVQNSEIFLYRADLKPCGIIIPKDKEPNIFEIEYHIKYNLPFIITQERSKSIENTKFVFEPNEEKTQNEDLEQIKQIINDLEQIKSQNKQTNIYTGREIAIFTDSHAMFEPTLAVLETVRKRGITEIYSLGDNIGLGPNPCEVIDLLEEYKVKSVAGNSEYYQTIGTETFTYFDNQKKANEEWTSEKLGSKYIEKLKLYPSSIDILLGTKKIALCHFINDVRWDYTFNSTWSYQTNFEKGKNAKQFLYTNSKESKEYILNKLNLQENKCLIDSLNNPLFNGKQIDAYDDIFEGHVHFEIEDKINNTNIHSLRACGMGWETPHRLYAKVYILKEKKDGTFDIETINPYYNKTNLVCNIKSSSLPYKEKILKFLK